MMKQSVPGLVETRHELPAAERDIEAGVLSGIHRHLAGFTGTMRDAYDAMTASTPIAPGVSLVAVDQAPAPGWWVRPTDAPEAKAILFLHGGAYMVGSAQAYRGFASQVAVRAGVAAFVLDYPLAPEHPFPAAYDIVVAALGWLATEGISQVALVGDSAGGALALAALSGVGEEAPAIASVVVFSPWTDLALTGASFLDPETYDPIFQRPLLTGAANTYLAGADARDGRASPLHALPDVLPPIAIQVGADELLLDDARRYAAAAAAQRGEVRLDVYEGLHHVFQRSVEELPSARRALDATAAFITRHW
jgi:monoterpene epsilon-lactone hydrolase